jgi:hypothetical protein
MALSFHVLVDASNPCLRSRFGEDELEQMHLFRSELDKCKSPTDKCKNPPSP